MGRLVAIVSVLLLAISVQAFAQGTSLSLGTVSAQSGQAVSVPLNVTNFSNVGAISIKVSYDPAVLSYTGVSHAAGGITFTTGSPNGAVALGWFDATGSTPLSVADGKLVDLNFTLNGGTSALSFVTAECEIADGLGTPKTVTYQNGGVTTVAASIQLSIGSIQANTGQRVDVAINTDNFNNVGAISLKIQYNPAALTFVGLANVAKTGFNYNAINNELAIAWFDDTGRTPLYLGQGKLCDMTFTYNGGASQLAFITAQCEIADSTGTALTVVYHDGGVTLTGVSEDNSALPVRFDLLQNYPNPFNPTTNINYELPKDAKVTLKVYNLIGEEVATLVDATQSAGRYEVKLDAHNLASGVYLYKISAGDFVSTKKLVLAK